MNIIETSQVLARIQAYHGGFETSKEKVAAWHELLEPYTYRDCIEAVKDYFRNPGDWIMPSDIISRVKDYQSRRLLELGGYLHLTEADEMAAFEDGTYSEKMNALTELAKSGAIAKPEYDAYHAGKIPLTHIARKEIGR